jgi:hypothetical protein
VKGRGWPVRPAKGRYAGHTGRTYWLLSERGEQESCARRAIRRNQAGPAVASGKAGQWDMRARVERSEGEGRAEIEARASEPTADRRHSVQVQEKEREMLWIGRPIRAIDGIYDIGDRPCHRL